MILTSIKNLKFLLLYAMPFILIFIYFVIEQQFYSYEIKYSSVWCKGLTGSKLCTFKNICYDSKFSTFIFFLSSFSVIKGLPDYKEFQTIQLSSIHMHNKFEANISIKDFNYYPVKNVKLVKKGLVFSRFKPDNIMHVIHDDLIPLFQTMQEICLDDMLFCEKNYQLLFHDNYQIGPYYDLYKIFTNSEPVLLPLASKILCFDELHMGLVQDSVFYQYGFNQVQGPVENSKITGNDLSQFASFVKKKLNLKTATLNESNIVLISRKKSRRILNEENLLNMLEAVCNEHNSYINCKVVCLDLDESKTPTVIQAVSEAYMLVGMHGAEMIFSIFLKKNSTLVELFPFGIQPQAVSFVKALTNIEGIYFNYISWVNSFKNHSIFHPDADPLHGGINHLPQHIQTKIIKTEKVPAVKCCNDPTYLHHMYQDTFIDSSFQQFLTSELIKINSVMTSTQIYDKWFFPSIVSRVSCQYNHIRGQLNLSWMKPFNIETESLIYDVFVLGHSNFTYNTVIDYAKLEINVSAKNENNIFEVWVTAIMKRTGTRSKDVYTKCNSLY